MNHFYFYSKQLIKVFEDHKELISFISSIDEVEKSNIINPQYIVNVPDDQYSRSQRIVTLRSQINSKNQKVLELVRSIKPNQMYELVNSFITALNLVDNSYNDYNSLIKLLKEFLENHTDVYSDKKTEQIFEIIENNSSIYQAIQNAKEKAQYIITGLDKSKKDSPTDYIQLTIGTDQDVPLVEDFVLIFEKIQGLYNAICQLHKTDSENKPLFINQVSTGSWYSEISGMKQAIISIENLLKGLGGFIRDYITGKIALEKFENECKKTEAFIDLMAIAKENGMEEEYEKLVFRGLKPFIESFKSDTTAIEVNEEEILKINETDKLTLAKRKSKRTELLESIQLSIEEKKENKTDNKKK